MPSAFDRFMPRTAIQFPDGVLLTVGTVAGDDQVHQAVYLSYTPAVAVPNVTGGSIVRSAAYAFLRRMWVRSVFAPGAARLR
jgi:hypothetical protein